MYLCISCFHYQQLGELLFIRNAKKKQNEFQSLIEISLQRSGGTLTGEGGNSMIGKSQMRKSHVIVMELGG